MRLILIKTGSPVPHLLQALVLMDESLSSHPHTARARLRSLGPLCGCGAWISGDLDSHPLLSCITFHCLDPRSAFPYIDLPLPFRKVPRELPQTAQGGPGLRRSLFSPHPRSTAWLGMAFQNGILSPESRRGSPGSPVLRLPITWRPVSFRAASSLPLTSLTSGPTPSNSTGP